MASHTPSISAEISVAEAQTSILEAIDPVTDIERIKLQHALHRILAEEIIAPSNIPEFDNSAMDGYAFRAADLEQVHELVIVGKSLAGHPYPSPLLDGQAVYITTGAAMPTGADTVLPQEFAEFNADNHLNMQNVKVRAGQNRRVTGEEITKGETIMAQGTRLTPADLGILASLGIASVSVLRPLRVAIFSTGDELCDLNQERGPGTVFDSNRTTLHALLTRCGVQVLDLGILADDHDTISTALQNIVGHVDVIITSGGVSVGAADYTKQVMQELGSMNFWSVKMRPGRPLAFGSAINLRHKGKTCLFGLPGNPVAMMISFQFFVRPALQRLAGAKPTPPMQIAATIDHALAKKPGRTEFQRGICVTDAAGQLHVRSTGDQGSAMLTSMAKANCLIVLPPDQGNVDVGDQVKVLLLDWST